MAPLNVIRFGVLLTFLHACAFAIEGQVFVVTKGRENVKMGAITVSIYKSADFSSALAAAAARIAPELFEINEQVARCDREIKVAEISRLSSESYKTRREHLLASIKRKYQGVWSGLRQIEPLAEVVTDADGRFKIDTRGEDSVYLFARAQRQVGGATENYIWVEQANGPTVILSNQQDSGTSLAAGFCKLAYEEFLAERKKRFAEGELHPKQQAGATHTRQGDSVNVKVGMSKHQVSEALGKPTVETNEAWFYSGRGWVRFSGDKVTSYEERR